MSGGKNLVTTGTTIGCSHQVARKGESHERRPLVGSTTSVLLQSQQVRSLIMTVRDSAGTTCGIVWRHFLGQTRFIPQSSKQCSAIRNRRQLLAIFMR